MNGACIAFIACTAYIAALRDMMIAKDNYEFIMCIVHAGTKNGIQIQYRQFDQ